MANISLFKKHKHISQYTFEGKRTLSLANWDTQSCYTQTVSWLSVFSVLFHQARIWNSLAVGLDFLVGEVCVLSGYFCWERKRSCMAFSSVSHSSLIHWSRCYISIMAEYACCPFLGVPLCILECIPSSLGLKDKYICITYNSLSITSEI